MQRPTEKQIQHLAEFFARTDDFEQVPFVRCEDCDEPLTPEETRVFETYCQACTDDCPQCETPRRRGCDCEPDEDHITNLPWCCGLASSGQACDCSEVPEYHPRVQLLLDLGDLPF